MAVEVGCAAGNWWFIRTQDGNGTNDCDDTRYESEEAARKAAEDFAAEAHEAGDGEDAEAYLSRKLVEGIGEESGDGPYALYFGSACSETEGIKARYQKKSQAVSAMVRANLDLAKNHPGPLLCGYTVRELDEDGAWSEVEP